MVRQAPFGHDRAAARDNTGQTLRRHRYVAQQYARVDGEVVYALFSLLQQRVAEGFPGEVFGNTVHFLQCLINGHRSDRHRAISEDPLAGFVDVTPGGEIHHRVRAPACRPDQFFHLFFNGGGHG